MENKGYFMDPFILLRDKTQLSTNKLNSAIKALDYQVKPIKGIYFIHIKNNS